MNLPELRKIIHIDMDAFYDSVEVRDNPQLKNLPVAVGGSSDRRGVIATCNYQARTFGVHSAMATAHALKLCPDLVLVPGRMSVYQEVSDQVRQIFLQYTQIIEPLSLDEAFLDVSNCTIHQGSATLIAEQIRKDIFSQTGLTASAGIAPIKFLSKVASDENKPNGQFVITPNEVDAFIDTMALKKIPGVGKVTASKLEELGLFTGCDIKQKSQALLIQYFGKFGHLLWQRCHGIDERQVQTSRRRKSIGVERTFPEDISDFNELKLIINNTLIPELIRRAEKHLEKRTVSKLGVKIKFTDFVQTTKEIKWANIDAKILENLLFQALERGQGKAVRLLGVHIGLSEDEQSNENQLTLF